MYRENTIMNLRNQTPILDINRHVAKSLRLISHGLYPIAPENKQTDGELGVSATNTRFFRRAAIFATLSTLSERCANMHAITMIAIVSI